MLSNSMMSFSQWNFLFYRMFAVVVGDKNMAEKIVLCLCLDGCVA